MRGTLNNPRGGIESDLTIARLGADVFRVTTGTAFGASDMGWITMHLPGDGSVEVRDVTMDYACLGLWGPEARRVLQKVTRDDISNAAFPYLSTQHIDVEGVKVLAQRVSYVGELGWELYFPVEHAFTMWDLLLAEGEEFGIRPEPWMCLQNAMNLGIYPMEALVKVDDTLPGIEEGLNAAMWTIGLAKTGNEIGLNEPEISKLSPDDLSTKLNRAYTRMAQSGAHYVADGIWDVPRILDDINARLARGERP